MRTVLASIMVACLAWACSKSTDPDTAAYWIDRLGDKAQRADALKQLGKIGDKKALPHVLEYFDDKGEWQPDAAFALGQLGDESVVPKLVEALDYQIGSSSDRVGRQRNRTNINIMRALGLLKAKKAVPEVGKFLESGEPTLREAAIHALQEIGDSAAVDPLVKLAKTDREPFLRKIAIQALGNIGDPKAIAPLIELLFIEMPGVSFYYEARHSLVQMGKGAVEPLIKTLKRENATVEAIRLSNGDPIGQGAIEAKAASVLGYLGATQAEPLMTEALDKLYKQFQKRDSSPVFASVPGAIRELCYALGNMGTAGAAKGVLAVAVDADQHVREPAAEALTQIGERSVIPAMLNAAKKGNLASRQSAILAISRLGLASDLAAFDALAKAGDKEVGAAQMAEMVKVERVRLVAAKECKTDVGCWGRKLKDPDIIVRDKAAWELGWSANKDAINDLMGALEDEAPVVRMAAILSLTRIGGADVTKLEAIYDKYAGKLEYHGINQELQRLIARLKANKR